MKPSLSLILFTLTSGIGLGLYMMYFIFSLVDPSLLNSDLQFYSVVISLVLTVVGLSFSTLHLANPRNAWKAFNRVRTSWLSREGVLALLFLLLAAAHLASVWMAEPANTLEYIITLSGTAAAITALLTVFSTAMIYASLKPIPQWHNPLVPVIFILLSLASGGVLLIALYNIHGMVNQSLFVIVMSLLITSGLVKVSYFLWIGRSRTTTLGTATGITQAGVRLMDTGHSHGTFLTEEFGFALARRYTAMLRMLALGLGFVAPPLILTGIFSDTRLYLGWIAFVSLVAGLFVERTLFFTEAEHVVNRYHGR